MELRSINEVENIINIMNGASKENFQAIGVSGRSCIIVATRKVIGKHNQLKIVQGKVENLQKKINAFKSRFQDLFKMGLPSFWDVHVN